MLITIARAENAVLQEKVKQLTERVKFLTVENETLKAEVELYRNEAAVSCLSRLSMNAEDAVDSSNNAMQTDHVLPHDYFVKSGNGIYPNQNEVTLSHWFGSANPLCCTLSNDDTLVAAGAANGYVNVVPWGALDAKQPDRMSDDNEDDDAVAKQLDALVQSQSLNMSLNAPVICTSFSPYLSRSHGTRAHVMAAGCMDGSFQVMKLHHSSFQGLQLASTTISKNVTNEYKHRKYIRTVAWSPTHPLLATASADGNVQIFQVKEESDQGKDVYKDSEEETPSHLSLTRVQSLHFPGAVESLTFLNDHQLVCYARGTPYLSVFDMSNDFAQSRIHLNSPNGKTVDDHVSFAVMDLNVWQNKFLVAATDAARNMVIDTASGQQVRNLYGHANDGYSQPKAVWSQTGQYILGNTQDDGALCIWDIASSRMVERLSTAHASPIRNLFSSPLTDMLVTTSFDKQTKLWFVPQQC